MSTGSRDEPSSQVRSRYGSAAAAGFYRPIRLQKSAKDIGAADEIHGEAGDDFIYGMVGNDVLFGDAQDDDIMGGYGNDWISGGTGSDGILGDDGRIFTSRNGAAEPLNRVTTATTQTTITTPGNLQSAIINQTGALNKSVDMTPFSVDTPWNATTDEFGGPTNRYAAPVRRGGGRG